MDDHIDPIVVTPKERRQRFRMSQQELAELLGTVQSAISDWEAGSNITLASLQRWCTVLGFELRLKSFASTPHWLRPKQS